MAVEKASSLVKETTTTTGTGTYTLAGAKSGFRAFSTVATPGAAVFVPYVCRLAGVFEIGIGELTAATTLVRTLVLESSSGDAAVNWTAGTKEIYLAPTGTGSHFGKHNKLDNEGTTIPGSGSSFGAQAGYGLGTLWRYVCGETGATPYVGVYLNTGCSADTNVSNWAYISPSMAPIRDEVSGNALKFGIHLLSTGTNNLARGGVTFVSQAGDGPRSMNSNSHTFGLGWEEGIGEHQVEDWGGYALTADATPGPASYYGAHYYVEELSAVFVRGRVVAMQLDGTDAKAWDIIFLVRREASGVPVIVDSVTKNVIKETAGASTWDVAVASDGVDSVEVTVTGEAATNISWTVHYDALHVRYLP